MDTPTPIERFARWWAGVERGRRCIICGAYIPGARSFARERCSVECEDEYQQNYL